MNWRSNAWEQYQCAQLSECLQGINGDNKLQAAPLYPGSMLFNQIAVIDHPQTTDLAQYRPQLDSLDSVYEAIGVADTELADEPRLLIDCQGWDSPQAPNQACNQTLAQEMEQNLLDELTRFFETHGKHGRAMLVDSKHIGQLTRMCNCIALRYRIIRPRWWQASQWLRWYRNAERCVFVDSARVLDATITGVPCHFLSTQAYVNKPVSRALYAGLTSHQHCQITSPFVDNTCNRLKIIENDLSQLRQALGADIIDNLARSPVICAERLWQHQWRNKLGNLQVSTRRKSRKLVEDPRAFFKDSKLPGSDSIAAVFPDSPNRINNSQR